MQRSNSGSKLAAFVAVAALAVVACQRAEPPKVEAHQAADLAALDRGVGLMGQFDFAAAREIFAQLVARHPQWLEARFDLAIATLNRQGEGDERAAGDQLRTLQVEKPNDLRVLYTLGLLTLHGGSPKGAEALLRRVVEGDPRDAYAQYFLGQVLLTQGRVDEALVFFERAIALDSRLRSAQYGAAQALGRLGRTGEAQAHMDEFQRLQHNPLASLAEFKYTRMGPKSEVVSASRALPRLPVPSGPLFGEPQVLVSAERDRIVAGAPVASAADIDGDGEVDLFLPGGRGATSSVMLRRGDHFEAQPQHPLAAVRGVEFAAWGDIDNDGLIDVLLCRSDASPLLFRQHPRGVWKALDVPALAKLGGARDCALFDADHDGDLDIFVVTAKGERVLISNNGDGTFRSLANRLPAAPRPGSATQVIAADLDNDRALDLVVMHDKGVHEAFDNQLMWNWRPAQGLEQFLRDPALAAVAADLDASGETDLLTLTPELGVRRWNRGTDGTWRATDIIPGPGPAAPGVRPQIAAADLDGDGRPEIIVSSLHGVAVWRWGDRAAQQILDIDDDTIVDWTLATLDDKGPALITRHRDGSTRLRMPGPGRSTFVRIALSGRDDPAASIRSNASGIGARIAARIEGRWVVEQTWRSSSGPGQSLVPVAIGLGGAMKIDYVRIDWPDGVFQTELAIEGPQVHRIVETQRQLSSCPLLFAWDGRHYAFVSDLLGVGGLGYLVAPGDYAPARPWENFLLPQGVLQPLDGRYVVKIAEPMEEAAYLDAIGLVAYDLPPGWDMVLDERMQIGKPDVTGRALYFRRLVLPQRATNDRGEDVTAAVRAVDRHAADPGERDRRFIGRLAHEHVLTLEFADDLDAQHGAPVLIADGWIEYPYSQTMFAAWQAHAAYQAPTLEARGRDGRWWTVLEQFGYPAGMPRTMAVPLPRLPEGTRALRLRTNMEIYWDRVAVAWAEPASVPFHALALEFAELRETGFPRRTTGSQQQPDYDYEKRVPLWDTRRQSGHYTDFGRIDELIAAQDDAFAIIGPGEEVHVEFGASLPALQPGWSRRFVLEARGWAKDMDLYTRDGDSLEPLPASRGRSEARDRLNHLYNRRVVSDR